MEKLEITLALQGEEIVAKAHDLVLSFQGGTSPNGNKNDLSDGNITVMGKQTLVLANNQVITTDLKPVQIRLAEQETMIAAMASDTPEKLAAKTAAQAKFDIWKTFIDSLHDALTTALKANYELENPI